MNTCKSCRFWQQFPRPGTVEPVGNCKRHSPALHGRPDPWPKTWGSDWCGDFESSKPPQNKAHTLVRAFHQSISLDGLLRTIETTMRRDGAVFVPGSIQEIGHSHHTKYLGMIETAAMHAFPCKSCKTGEKMTTCKRCGGTGVEPPKPNKGVKREL